LTDACRAEATRAAEHQEDRVDRPGKFEDHRWLGDKRSQVVYDVDHLEDPAPVDGLLAAESFICFGPDTLAEARNRGYKPYRGNGSGVTGVDVSA
jgi:hypothetical protein